MDYSAYYDPIAVLITKRECQRDERWKISSERHTFVVSATPPLTTLTKSLSKYLCSNSVNRLLEAGVCSEGLITTVHPAAIAPAFQRMEIRIIPVSHFFKMLTKGTNVSQMG